MKGQIEYFFREKKKSLCGPSRNSTILSFLKKTDHQWRRKKVL